MINYKTLTIKEMDDALYNLPFALSNHIISQTDAESIRYELMTAKERFQTALLVLHYSII